MVDALSEYLRAASAERFDAERRNCMLWVSAWIQLRTGVNPADYPRHGETLLEVATHAMRDFSVTDEPQRGDVGIVLAPQPTAAICTGGRWAALAPQGLACAPWEVLRAWSLHA